MRKMLIAAGRFLAWNPAKRACAGTLLVAATILGGCGGGTTDSAGAATSPIATSAVVVGIEPGASGTAAVARLASPFGDVPVSAPLRVSSETNASTLVFATDANGEVLLMGAVATGESLSVDSTARALVNVALGMSDLSDDGTAASAKSQIAKSASFTTLMSNIASSLAAGNSPLSSPDVLASVVTVAQESLALAATAQGAAVQARARAQSVSVDSVPFYLWKNSATDKLWITDKATDSLSVILNNRTFLQWAVTSTADGKTVYLDPLKTTPAQLVALYVGSESTTEVAGDKKFSLALKQDSKTRLFNATRAATRVTFTLVETLLALTKAPESTAQKCVTTTSGKLLNSNEFANLVTSFSEASVQAFLKSAIKSAPDIASSCLGKTLDSSTDGLNPTGVGVTWGLAIEKVMETFNGFSKPFKIARSIAADYGTWSQLSEYNNYPGETYEICRYGVTIKPCIKSLTAESVNIAIGATQTVFIRATDVSGAVLSSPPAGLIFSTSDAAVFNVVNAVDGTGVVLKAIGTGTAGLTVTDPVSGTVSAPIPVSVTSVDTRYWLGTFTPVDCQSPPAGMSWFWERPCFNIGVIDGQYSSTFWFPSTGGNVTMESVANARIRKVFGVEWNATNLPILRLSMPTEVLVPSSSQGRFVRYFGTRLMELTVNQRTTNEIAGTFVVTSTSGAAVNITPDYPGNVAAPIETRATGTWSARLVAGPMPITNMNGFDLCFSDGGATNYRNLDSMVFAPGTGNWYTSLGWGSSAGTCVYGR